ncbi:WYL domain-containing protein [Paenibacillus sp. J5C_2022]|uniref:WYL domain-containing protein n=1 Tax=Paenibacillus sp. J5C2022 TaxID=2977129 RepID=UPI0021D05E25|nr:WYL domain-containing protein [Paenibacillus sp. J5C2022]MCU6711772.1 WYL domain-containing protein [Paenibacillus sp. J5C2022]
MSLFEKIFNYQILSRLHDNGTFMTTSHERSWLKGMLAHEAAAEAMLPDTLDKLKRHLAEEAMPDWDRHLLMKAAGRETQVYHPLIRPLRRAIMKGCLLQLDYGVKDGRCHEHVAALPYKLEYSMVKREWYLLWLHVRQRMMMSTRLSKIVAFRETECSQEQYAELLATVKKRLAGKQTSAIIRIVPEYNEELSRILYAFSPFERDMDYDEETGEYRITLYFAKDELEYVLSKLRFLGKRVQVIQNERLIQRMRQTVEWVMERYGEERES